MGLFERPRRGVLPTLDRARGAERYVYNERELRTAISDAARAVAVVPLDGEDFYSVAYAPFSIVIAQGFTTSERIDIPSELWGLKVRGIPGVVLTIGSSLTSGFQVGGFNTHFADLFIQASGDVFTAGTTTVADVYPRIVLTGSYVDCGSNDVVSGVFENSVISGNRLSGGISVGSSREGSRNVIAANHFNNKGVASQGNGTSVSGNTGLNSVTISGGATDCAVTGNAMRNGGITTTASGGNNAIVGNANTGTRSLHGTDSDVGNTT